MFLFELAGEPQQNNRPANSLCVPAAADDDRLLPRCSLPMVPTRLKGTLLLRGFGCTSVISLRLPAVASRSTARQNKASKLTSCALKKKPQRAAVLQQHFKSRWFLSGKGAPSLVAYQFFFFLKGVDVLKKAPPYAHHQKHYILMSFFSERKVKRFTPLPRLSVEPSICCVWFRVIRHGNGGPGHEVIGSAEEGAGGCLLIL